jgi:hypothetical protein
MLLVDIFPWVVQLSAVTGSTMLHASAARCSPCGPQRGLSMASASGHVMPGGTPLLGSSAVCSLAVG